MALTNRDPRDNAKSSLADRTVKSVSANGQKQDSHKAAAEWNSDDLRWGRDRIFEGNAFNGTYVVYGAAPIGVTPFVCDVNFESLQESDATELRAYRLRRSKAGKKLRPLRSDALHEEMLIAFGPELSAEDAVRALQRLIDDIKGKGLLIGRVEPEGDFLVERVDGKIVA